MLLKRNTVSREVEEAIYNDPFYGLNNLENYFHWNAFLSTANPLANLAWSWEVRTYFGLTIEQVAEMEVNWRELYHT